MKVIHVTPSYKPAYTYGGPTVSISSLCEALVENHCEVQVLTTTANGKYRLAESQSPKLVDGVPVRYFKSFVAGNIHLSLKLLWQLHLELRQCKVVVHVHSWWNLTAIITCLITLAYKSKVILSPRGMLTPYSFKNRHAIFKQVLHLIIGKSLLKRCLIHATSEKEKHDIQTILQLSNIKTIPNIIKFPQLITPPFKNTGCTKQFKILSLSRIEQKKGLEILLHALKKLEFSWQLTIGGAGKANYIDSLKNLAQELGIQNKLKWIGFLNYTEKYTELISHNLTVLFSHNENFANTILESLHVGTAVAISDQIGLAPFVEQYNLGWISTLNVDSIANVLSRAYLDSDKLLAVRNTAALRVSECYAEERLIKQYLDLYEQQ